MSLARCQINPIEFFDKNQIWSKNDNGMESVNAATFLNTLMHM